MNEPARQLNRVDLEPHHSQWRFRADELREIPYSNVEIPYGPRSSENKIRTDSHHATVIDATRRWISAVVIGLDLCPFARHVFQGNLIRYVVSDASDAEELRADLANELETLAHASPDVIETTLLIHPDVLGRFSDSCDFLTIAESLLRSRGHRGVIQIVSFHPQYQFADATENAVENYTNRSPYPMLHLLREQSVSAAVNANALTNRDIPARNIALLRSLGLAKILELTTGGKPHAV